MVCCPALSQHPCLFWSGRTGGNTREIGLWLRMGPGLGLREAHISHDLELSHVDQLGGQELPQCFLLVAKLQAHLLGWGKGWFS